MWTGTVPPMSRQPSSRLKARRRNRADGHDHVHCTSPRALANQRRSQDASGGRLRRRRPPSAPKGIHTISKAPTRLVPREKTVPRFTPNHRAFAASTCSLRSRRADGRIPALRAVLRPGRASADARAPRRSGRTGTRRPPSEHRTRRASGFAGNALHWRPRASDASASNHSGAFHGIGQFHGSHRSTRIRCVDMLASIEGRSVSRVRAARLPSPGMFRECRASMTWWTTPGF